MAGLVDAYHRSSVLHVLVREPSQVTASMGRVIYFVRQKAKLSFNPSTSEQGNLHLRNSVTEEFGALSWLEDTAVSRSFGSNDWSSWGRSSPGYR